MVGHLTITLLQIYWLSVLKINISQSYGEKFVASIKARGKSKVAPFIETRIGL